LGAFEWLAFSGSLGLVIYGIVMNRKEGGMEGGDMPEYNMGIPYEQGQAPPQQPQQMYQQGAPYA
jgi:hypothetical protein